MTSDEAENIDFLENCKLTLKEGEEKHYLRSLNLFQFMC